MTSYAAAVRRPPRTLTALEQARLLKVTGEHRDGFRDHVLLSLALGTALREHELAALDVGDVLRDDGRVRRRFTLRTFKRPTSDPANQDVFLPDSAWHKLAKFIAWKRGQGESLEPTAPLFVSRRGLRIATRTLRHMFRLWQKRAGFDRLYNFHSLRHYADLRVMPSRAFRVGFADENAKMSSSPTSREMSRPPTWPPRTSNNVLSEQRAHPVDRTG